jgi:hypothetical protein
VFPHGDAGVDRAAGGGGPGFAFWYLGLGLNFVDARMDGDAYRESSQIQLTSHAFPPSEEKDCSIREDLGEMSSQT